MRFEEGARRVAIAIAIAIAVVDQADLQALIDQEAQKTQKAQKAQKAQNTQSGRRNHTVQNITQANQNLITVGHVRLTENE